MRAKGDLRERKAKEVGRKRCLSLLVYVRGSFIDGSQTYRGFQCDKKGPVKYGDCPNQDIVDRVSSASITLLESDLNFQSVD